MINVSKRMRNAQETLKPVPACVQTEKWELPSSEIIIVNRPAPWDMQILSWVDYQIRTPRRIVRCLLTTFRWSVGIYLKAGLLWLAITGPRVTVEVYAKRQIACEACKQKDEQGYCRSCGCGRWPLARLDRKNWYERWLCPQRRHAGTYVRYTWLGRNRGCGAGKGRGNEIEVDTPRESASGIEHTKETDG